MESDRRWQLGMVAWALQALETAINHFIEGITLARLAQAGFEEFLCQLPLASIYTSQGRFEEAENHLRQAQRLISDKSDRLAFRFREIQYHHRAGMYSDDYALLEFEALSEEFAKMGLIQEQGWVRVHMAALFLKTGNPRLEHEIEALKTLAVTLQNPAFLNRELIFLPDLREHLRTVAPALAGGAGDRLEVRTLGEERLLYNDEEVQIPLRRAVEVVAYVLEHKSVRLDDVIRDVFPDSKPRAARSYFHQVRHHLSAAVPGLDIHFDRESRLYHLKSELDLLWDVAEVRAGRYDSPPGGFLPSSSSPWVEALEGELERYRREDARR